MTRRETPLSHSFYKHAVAWATEPLVVRDARKDATFRDNPAVQELGIVAYAGVPLMHGGQALGTLCVIDVEPRAWSYDEIETLRIWPPASCGRSSCAARLREAESGTRRAAETRQPRHKALSRLT